MLKLEFDILLIVEILPANSANPNIQSKNGKTALNTAIEIKNCEIIEILEKACLTISEEKIWNIEKQVWEEIEIEIESNKEQEKLEKCKCNRKTNKGRKLYKDT